MAIMAFRTSSSSVCVRLPFVHPPPQVQDVPKLVEDIVQTSISTGPRGALRLAQGVQAVVGVGSEWLEELSKWTNTSGGVPIELQLGILSPYCLRKLFERLGATCIKLGQFIASAPTMFPPEYVEEFQKCFDRAPVAPFEEIKDILNQELQRPIGSVYEYVDPTPIASASIAQVHVARLKGSQEEVVIKVLKPGTRRLVLLKTLENQCLKKWTSPRRLQTLRLLEDT